MYRVNQKLLHQRLHKNRFLSRRISTMHRCANPPSDRSSITPHSAADACTSGSVTSHPAHTRLSDLPSGLSVHGSDRAKSQLATTSNASQTLLGSTNTSVVIVPSSSASSATNHTTALSGIHPSNLVTNNPSVSALSVVTAAPPTQSTVVPQPVQWIPIQPPSSANHQPVMTASVLQTNQVGSGTTTLRFRTVPGSATLVQSQPQPQVQHFYSTTSSLGPTNIPNFTNNVSGTGPVGAQQVMGTTQRSTSGSNPTLTSLGRQNAAPQAAIVHFRSQQQSVGTVNSVQPHIILTNTNAPGQLQHQSQPQLITTSGGGRQVVALMTHQQSGAHPNGSDPNSGLLDPGSTVGNGLGPGINPSVYDVSVVTSASPIQSTVVSHSVQWIPIQSVMAASVLQMNQVGSGTKTLRFLTVLGSAALVQSQPRSRVKHFYCATSSLGPINITNFTNNVSGTGMLVSIMNTNMGPFGAQQVMGIIQRSTSGFIPTLTSLGRQNAAPQAVIVHFRPRQHSVGTMNSVQPQIILTDTDALVS
ncbi:CREB-binding protein 1 (SmCBP1) [Fasciola gigantica]|uniref:CREB-binding protein 1 (SmCBP1) n=1 Tax=Fasciola gigantica TaxID=46835 RepID=A0A504YFU2_FASGI|nr:CREB-binding protein 1 (SmCBP1) [Fasciola gigantica]